MNTLPTLDDVATGLGLTVPGLARRLSALGTVVATCSTRAAPDCRSWDWVSMIRADGWVCPACERRAVKVRLVPPMGG